MSSGVFAFDLSDHCPIACITDMKQKNTNLRLIKKKDFKTFSLQGFLNNMLYSELATISCIPDTELALENVSYIFIPLADKHAPFKQFRVKDSS